MTNHPNPDQAFAADLVAALAALSDIPKGEQANAGKKIYRYFDLAGLHAATRPVLAAHNLAATQDVTSDGSSVTVETVLVHASGATWRSGAITMRCGTDPQAIGSAITYARRYSLSATLGVAGDADDDGAAARDGAERWAARPVDPPPAHPEAEALFARLMAASDATKQAVKALAADRGEKLTRQALENDAWRADVTELVETIEGGES